LVVSYFAKGPGGSIS